MKPIPLIIGTMVLGGIVHLTLLFYKKYKTVIPSPTREITPTGIEPIVTGKKSAEFSSEFVKIADKFELLYNELQTVSLNNQDKYSQQEFISIITEWELKIKCHSNGSVLHTWSGLVEKHFIQQWFEDDTQKTQSQLWTFLAEWYRFLLGVGIEQDNRKLIKVEDYTLHHFYIIRGLYNVGDELEIERPCWKLNNKCIERGVANIIRKQE